MRMIRSLLIPFSVTWLATALVVPSTDCVLAGIAATGVNVQYHYSVVTEGIYANQLDAVVIMNGSKWRIDYRFAPGVVMDHDSVLNSGDGRLIALNNQNRTWFWLPERQRPGIRSTLFSFGDEPNVKELRVTRVPNEEPGRTEEIRFSYRVLSKFGEDRITSQVRGRLLLWRITVAPSTADRRPATLPLTPTVIYTGLSDVDAAFRTAVGASADVAKSVLEVERSLEGGAALRQVITASISAVNVKDQNEQTFHIPPSYIYQEPVIGVPGAATPGSAYALVRR